MSKPGSVRLTGDSNVTAGRPARIYSVTWLSGATAADMVLRNGTTDTDAIYFQAPGVISDAVTFNFEGGLHLPDGLFYDHDANTTFATIAYSLE